MSTFASRVLLAGVLALAAGVAGGYLAARRDAPARDPAHTALAELCRRGGRAFAGDATPAVRSTLHGVLGASCVPALADRAARNAAADAWSRAVDRCLLLGSASGGGAACAEVAALAEQYATQLSAR